MTSDQGLVLVACPTYAGKEPCLEPWLDGYKALDYEPKRAYQIDNTTGTQNYYERVKRSGIDASYLSPWPDWDRTMKKCWELILQRAQDLDAYWIYSVEADNVPAPESLQLMVDLALYGGIHLVTHAYPLRKEVADAAGVEPDSFMYQELGCMLVSRQLLEHALNDFDEFGNIAMAIFVCADRYRGGNAKLWQRFEVKHLDSYKTEFSNLEPSKVEGLTFPVEVGDKIEMGTEVPESLKV